MNVAGWLATGEAGDTVNKTVGFAAAVTVTSVRAVAEAPAACSVIFFTMTALPEREAQNIFSFEGLVTVEDSADGVDDGDRADNRSVHDRIGGHGFRAECRHAVPLMPAGLSSTALTALDPMSSPMTPLGCAKHGATSLRNLLGTTRTAPPEPHSSRLSRQLRLTSDRPRLDSGDNRLYR